MISGGVVGTVVPDHRAEPTVAAKVCAYWVPKRALNAVLTSAVAKSSSQCGNSITWESASWDPGGLEYTAWRIAPLRQGWSDCSRAASGVGTRTKLGSRHRLTRADVRLFTKCLCCAVFSRRRGPWPRALAQRQRQPPPSGASPPDRSRRPRQTTCRHSNALPRSYAAATRSS